MSADEGQGSKPAMAQKPSTGITLASVASSGFKLQASPDMPSEEVLDGNAPVEDTSAAGGRDAAPHPSGTAGALSQASSLMEDGDSGMFTFERPNTGRPGSRSSGNPTLGSRLNTGIGISNISMMGAAGRPLTGIAIPEEVEGMAEEDAEPFSPAAALAAAYRGGQYVPPKTATRTSMSTPIIELDERMKTASHASALDNGHSSPAQSGMTEYSMTTDKVDMEKIGAPNPYENLSPEELFKMAAELDLMQAGHSRPELLDIGDEEDSPFAEVRASVSNFDDPNMPCLTFRAAFIGLSFTIIGAALNTYFQLRYPAPLLTTVLVEILAYPYGVFLARILPVRDFKTPRLLQKIGLFEEWSFNPGPFNIKEHTVIMIMANVGLNPAYAVNIPLTLNKFYGKTLGAGFDVLFLLSTQVIGFSFAGLVRRFLVWPAAMIWPSNLVICTLLNSFHAEEFDGSDGSLSKLRYFWYVFAGAFVWYFVPGYLFVGLSAFSWICWVAPQKPVVNQLFGVINGLGMSCLTFDWSQIAYINSPLIVPWWALVNVFVGFVGIYWIIAPALYYTNVWDSAYLPISTNTIFDRFGAPYNTSRVLTPDLRLDIAAYEQYSPAYLPITFAMLYLIYLALASSSLVHLVLYHGKDMWKTVKDIKNAQTDIHAKLMLAYKEVPWWWYGITFSVFIAMAIAVNEAYDSSLPVWGVLLALLLPAIYILPAGIVYALSNQGLSISLLAQLIPGYLLPNRPMANVIFKAYSNQSLINALYWVQDLKLGHYMKIPPRTTFAVQLSATCVAACIQVAMLRLLETVVPDLCSRDQAALLSCPVARITYNASLIWGLIGPERILGPGAPYNPILWALLGGAFLPVITWVMCKYFKWKWAQHINIPVMLSGASLIPPASGINYSSWFITGFAFQFLLRRYKFRWWAKFGFITSAAMDSGTIASAILMFVTLMVPKGGINLNWWGNNVYINTYDAMGVPYLTPPDSGFGRTIW